MKTEKMYPLSDYPVLKRLSERTSSETELFSFTMFEIAVLETPNCRAKFAALIFKAGSISSRK